MTNILFYSIVLIWSFLSIQTINAQRTIEGIGNDNQGNPLSDVRVFSEDAGIFVTTNEKGYYKLQSIPDSVFTIHFSHPNKEMASADIGFYDQINVIMVREGSASLGDLSLEALLNLKMVESSSDKYELNYEY